MNGSDVRIATITVQDRYRRDLGDLTELAASIKELGLLQPVVLDKNLRLIAGERRLEACKRLGWTLIPATVVNGLDDAVKALTAERDENTCRKTLTPSELVGLGRAIEDALVPDVEARLAEGRRLGGLVRTGQVDGHVSNELKPPATRDQVGAALGISGRTYSRIKDVVEAAEDEADPAHDVAKEQQENMDAGKVSINAAHKRVRTARREAAQAKVVGGQDKTTAAVLARRERIKALAARGYNVDQIAAEVGMTAESVQKVCQNHGIKLPSFSGGSRKVDVDRVMRTTVTDLEHLAANAKSLLAGKYGDLDRTQLEGWAYSLAGSIRSLTTLKKQLTKELTHG